MSTVNYADVYKEFLDGGFGAKSEVLPTGTYRVRIALVKGDQKQGKKFAVGVRLVVIDEGPHKDKSTWINQTLTLPEAGKEATPFMMFLKFMAQLGAEDAIKAGIRPEKLHEHIVVGTVGVAQLRGDRTWGTPPRAQQDLVGFSTEAVPSPLGGMVAVSGAPAVPAPVAPVAVAAPVAVPVAVAPVAVAVPAPLQDERQPVTVEELQAQLAALTAQQAAVVPVAAAAAPIVAGPSF